ncbi:MAG: ABC transporter substrate-binding protein [Oscillospiraceae bacterium]|nr:ABC transporter substrate-binding protein [Oscillospiraceae bacterium]MCL2278734.1 ABC transporter substrate-binding protein [Oscillospiraceae bacterium]
MKIKKILALLLAITMIGIMVAACAPAEDGNVVPPPVEDPADPADPATPADPADPVPPPAVDDPRANTFTIGYGAPAAGDFMAGWGNSAYCVTIRNLISGTVSTVAFTNAGEFYINPTVVADYERTVDADGNITYTFTINQGLLWNDGTEITARDFVASELWWSSPEWFMAGATWGHVDERLGFPDYRGSPVMSEEPDDWGDDQEEPEDWDEEEDGEWAPDPYVPERLGWDQPNEYLAGVRLLGDYEFSVTVDAAHLPFFFEMIWFDVAPLPLHVWAPGVEVVSNENGSRFDQDIQAHADRVSTTERFHPTVTAGPYTFVSFENNIVTVQRNPLFGGDSQGRLPTIEFIQQVYAPDEVAVDMLFAGEVDLLPAEIRGARIERVIAEPGFSTVEILRNGYGMMNLVADWGPMQDVNVRWAFAHVVDRQAVLDNVLEGYGSLIDSEIGEAQWMWHARRAEVIEAIQPISLNIEMAHDRLDLTEWVFEADGSTPFDRTQANEQGTYLRHNAAGEPLVIHNGAANAEIGDAILLDTVRHAAMAGIEFTSQFLEWASVIRHFSQPWLLEEGERMFSTFSMGVTFAMAFDPYRSWHTDFIGTTINPTGFSDPEIDRLTLELRNTEPGDYASFLDTWFDYVVRWNEMMPALPLYSNMSVDLHSDRVVNLGSTAFVNWAQIITQISLAG